MHSSNSSRRNLKLKIKRVDFHEIAESEAQSSDVKPTRKKVASSLFQPRSVKLKSGTNSTPSVEYLPIDTTFDEHYYKNMKVKDCYSVSDQILPTPKIDNSCYELKVRAYNPNSNLNPFEEDPLHLRRHKKKLSSLKSKEYTQFDFIKTQNDSSASSCPKKSIDFPTERKNNFNNEATTPVSIRLSNVKVESSPSIIKKISYYENNVSTSPAASCTSDVKNEPLPLYGPEAAITPISFWPINVESSPSVSSKSKVQTTPVSSWKRSAKTKLLTSSGTKRRHSNDDDTTLQCRKVRKKRPTLDTYNRYEPLESPPKSPPKSSRRKTISCLAEVKKVSTCAEKTPLRLKRKHSDQSTSNLSTPVGSSRSCVTDQTPFQVEEPQRKRFRSSLPQYDAYEILTLKSQYGFIDSHCHLDFLFNRQGYEGTYSEYKEKHKDTFPKCYKGCIAVFCNPFTFFRKEKWSKFLEEKRVWGAFGCHPHNAKDYNDRTEAALISALQHSKVQALGEIGLDYSSRNNCMHEVQFDAFRRQMKIALREKLPLLVHIRDADEDGMKLMKETLPSDYVIHLHCFTGSWECASRWLSAFPNLYIGITNIVTFPSAVSVHEVARNMPLDRLLLETDAPYFVPRTWSQRFKVSHPGMAVHVAAQIAALKYIDIEQVLHWTLKNTKRVYNL